MLTVIVVNWNRRELLSECISSLMGQTVGKLDIVLVDNGSADDSVDFVRREFPKVRILALGRNFGFAGGNNRGIRESSSEFVALLNNDAVADSRWAERLLDAARDPRVGIVASRILLQRDGGKLDSAGDGMTTVGVGFKRGHLEPANRYAAPEEVFGASGCAMLLRRSMLEEIGAFDDDFFLLYEDSDLCFRARLRGWRCVYAPEAIVYHKLNASIGKLSRVHVFHGQRNLEFVYFKNMPGRLVWKHMPAHLLNLMLSIVYFAAKGQLLNCIRGKIEVVRHFRRLLQKRREIQALRTVSCEQIDRMLERKWLKSRLPGK